MATSNDRPDAKAPAKSTLQPAPQSSPVVVATPVVTPPLETQAEIRPKSSTRSPRWLTALLLLVLFAILFWVIYRGFGFGKSELTDSQAVTPAAGGMVVEATTAAGAPVTSSVAGATAFAAPTKPTGLQPGQAVAARGATGLRLYSDASLTSSIRDVYAAGALFTVLEPSGGYTAYPVSVNDHQWYRLRAADGLVGWAMMDAFTPAQAAPKPTSTATG